jgi:hypothetical protein
MSLVVNSYGVKYDEEVVGGMCPGLDYPHMHNLHMWVNLS